MDELVKRLVAMFEEGQERDNTTLDLLGTAFDSVAADLEAAGVTAANTRRVAAHLHGLALEFSTRIGAVS